MQYTPEQEYAINKRNADILVSAAAGSGKTAVLVERILSRLTDKNDPADIDNFLCLTFTEAAASEMREKIHDRITDHIDKHPEDEKMALQLKKLRKASVSTIDSFVGSIVKRHYHLVDIDPNYRIITGGEVTQLHYLVINDIFEKKYAEENIDFFGLIEYFCLHTDDKPLKDIVLQVYRFASSMPSPKGWLKESCDRFFSASSAGFGDTVWGKYILKQIEVNLKQLDELAKRCLHICEINDFYPPKVTELSLLSEQLLNHLSSDIERLWETAETTVLPNLTKTDVKKIAEGERLCVIYAKAKTVYEKTVKFLNKFSTNNWRENIEKLCPAVNALVELVLEFSEALANKKREDRIAEFDDISHFALDILIDENGKETSVAKSYQKQFCEVIIDEYQDCSRLQDSILEAVSRKSAGEPNRFMVGDIKQCIYKFRKASPDIFAGKYDKFGKGDEKQCLILLSKNFRSRKNILDTTNFFFSQFMSRGFGDVDYTDKVALNYGAQYSPNNTSAVELAYINTSNITLNETLAKFIDPDNIAISCEALYIANRIKSLLSDPEFMVEDIKTKIRYKIEPKDIVILLRTRKPIPIYKEIFTKSGIPVSTEQSISLFDAPEVKMFVSYLKVIDNPFLDICLTSVLFGPIYDITADELTAISDKSKSYLYESACQYAAEHEDETAHKLNRFFEDRKLFLTLAKRLIPLSELIEKIFVKTNFYSYAGLLSGGEQRRQNMDSLLSLAYEYDGIGKGDLGGFIQYLDTLAETGLDKDAAPTAETNSVRIMTMHQSKGLEFPVVFLPQLCNRFRINPSGFGKNNKTVNDNPNIVLNQDLGIGMKLIDANERTVSNTLTNLCIEELSANDGIRESLRLLYVAMTRAKEKLYMVGATRGKTMISGCNAYIDYIPDILPEGFMQNAVCYMDWLLTALARSNRQPSVNGISSELYYNKRINDFQFDLNYHYYDSENFEEITNAIEIFETSENSISKLFSALDSYAPTDPKPSVLDWVYPYSHVADLPSKTSISEIKHRYYEALQRESDTEIIIPKEFEKKLRAPVFEGDNMVTDAAAVGTIYHTFMEHIDFKIRSYDEIDAYLSELKTKGIFTEQEAAAINKRKIYAFLQSDICRRISLSPEVNRETAFTLGLTPYEVYKEERFRNDNDLIHVDGIIDLWFREDDGIILIDYKTDRIYNNDPSEVMERYRIQTELYAEAITRTTGLPVKQIGLYLFSLDRINFY